jgi:hypothetical protein
MLKFKFISTEDQEILLEEYNVLVGELDSMCTSEQEDQDAQHLYDFIYEIKSKCEQFVLHEQDQYGMFKYKGHDYLIIQDNGFHAVVKMRNQISE